MDFTALAAATQTADDAGFSFGTLLLFAGGAILLAFFCSIGLIARMREHRIEQRKEAGRTVKAAGDDDLPG